MLTGTFLGAMIAGAALMVAFVMVQHFFYWRYIDPKAKWAQDTCDDFRWRGFIGGIIAEDCGDSGDSTSVLGQGDGAKSHDC